MSEQPRRHHFVPQFYLAGFTKSGTPDCVLHVLDKERLQQWKSTPNGAAHKRDFHAVEAGPGGDPMGVEKALSKLEAQWSSVLRHVIEQQTIPEDETFGDLMVFVAFMAVRVIGIREVLSNFIDRVSKSQIQLMLATEEGRASFRKIVEQQGGKLSDDQFEQLLEFGQSEQYDVNFEQTWHVQEMVRMAAVLAPLLSLRKWCLWCCDDDAPDLICSDRPVAPTWAIPVQGPFSPAFWTPNTIVSVPLNRRVALLSMVEEQLPELRLDRNGVAAVNWMSAIYAKQLYSPQPDFVWTMKDYRIGNANGLLEALKNERQGESA